MTKLLSFLGILLLPFTILVAQNTNTDNNGTARVSVITSDGTPAPYVTIKIQRSKYAGISDEEGFCDEFFV